MKFYLGQNEDCSLGGSIPDSSERLLQRGGGGRSIYVNIYWSICKVLVKGKFNIIQHSFYRFSASYKDLMLP